MKAERPATFNRNLDTTRPGQPGLDRTLLALLAVLAVVLIALHHAPPVREWEHRALDLAFRIRRHGGPVKAPEIVLVGVDEGTEQAFPDPVSLWHRHFSAVFAGLAQGGVCGVGVDFAFPTRSHDALAPGSDAELVRSILLLRAQAPVVLGMSVDSSFRSRPVFPPFLAAAGPQGFGMILAPADPDGRLRRFTLRGGPGKALVPTLAGVLSQRLGVPPHEGLVDFAYGAPFSYVPFHQVAQWWRRGDGAALRAVFEGRVVLVGSVLPQEDRHPMAVNLAGWEADFGEGPGLTFQGQVLRCLLGRGLIREVPVGWVWVLSSAVGLGCWSLGRRWLLGVAGLATTWALLAGAFLLGLEHGWFLPLLAPAGAGLAALAARMTWGAILQARERRWLQNAFSGHVSPALLRAILGGRLTPKLAGHRAPICLLFSDIRGFTTLSEAMPPEEVIALLNRYFTRMAEVVHGRGGTVDKYMGDGLMAFFGAPEPLENASRSAFLAAQDMLEALRSLNLDLVREGRPPLAIGIGLHYGEAAVGYVGSASRHEYTAIGDTVNLASRVEGLTKEVGFPLLCTRAVFEHIANEAGLVSLGIHEVRGRGPVELFGWRPLADEPQGGDA